MASDYFFRIKILALVKEDFANIEHTSSPIVNHSALFTSRALCQDYP